MSLRHRITGLLVTTVLTLTGCSLTGNSGKNSASGGNSGSQATAGPTEKAALPYDVRPLLKPGKKYFGAAIDKAPTDMSPVIAYTAMVGKQPNLLEYYAAWGDGFNASGVRNAWNSGALTVMSWEPFDISVADIAAGKSDAYLKNYAEAVRKLNLPVVMDFADEFNGGWEKWGTKYVKPKDYVAAWRHIHDVFVDAGAGTVIWAWSPNIINPVPTVGLKQYYPGDGYVDWVGLIGYFTLDQDNAFSSVFGPTMKEIRTFTKKPFIIIETAAEPGQRRRADVRNLFKGVQDHDDLIGFVWFDIRKNADWRLSVSPLALSEYKRLAADDSVGFDVRKP